MRIFDKTLHQIHLYMYSTNTMAKFENMNSQYVNHNSVLTGLALANYQETCCELTFQ